MSSMSRSMPPAASPAAQRRLLADLKRLEEDPIPLAAARPCTDADITLWNGVIGAQVHVTHFGDVTVPLHFLIDFPVDYPNSAPSIGFSFEFAYRGGASYTMENGRLKGKKVICLDVLGNFGNVHNEWKTTVGSGWSPAYTVSTLLIQLQSVLSDLGEQMSQQERDVTYQSASRFCEKNPSAMLELLDEEDIRELSDRRQMGQQIAAICRGDESLVARVNDFARQSGLLEKEQHMHALLELLTDISTAASGSRAGIEVSVSVPTVDTNICCWSTGKLYTEALLGVGLSREGRNLGTAAELLSKEAFDGGLRQNTNKSPFEFFLPVWINEVHAAQQQRWRETLLTTCVQIGKKVYDVPGENAAIFEVFPRLINQMIVEIMKPDADKSAAIAIFEALCNFWRTFRWLVDSRPLLRSLLSKKVGGFVRAQEFRHKDHSPDLGMLLVSFTVLQGHPDCPQRQDFVDAYADENSLRWVMWWQRSGTPAEAAAVFQATKVSREIFMFQMMVIDVIIGDVGNTLEAMEATNCRLPERLEALQAQWREQKQKVNDWSSYFKCIGAAQPSCSMSQWISSTVERAATMGPKYSGAKGGGKGGNRKGNGKGKGGKF